MDHYLRLKFFHLPLSQNDRLKKYKMNECLEKEINTDKFEIVGAIYSDKDLSETGFNSSCFKKHSEDERLFYNFLENPEVDEGIYQCKNCKNRRIFTVSKQTRRGDESTTVFAKCQKCNSQWVIN